VEEGAVHEDGEQDDTAGDRSSSASAPQDGARREQAMADIVTSAKDAAYTAIGFGVLGFQRLQVRRQDLLRQLRDQRVDPDLSVEGARRQLSVLVRSVDEAIAPVRSNVEQRLDSLEGRLAGQAKEVVRSARSLVRQTEQQLRHAAGA